MYKWEVFSYDDNKKQVNELHKAIKSFNMQLISLDERLENLRNKAS